MKDLSNEVVVIVASGPGASAGLAEIIDYNRRRFEFITVNESWRLLNFPHIIYGADRLWWDQQAPNMNDRNFRFSLKIGAEPSRYCDEVVQRYDHAQYMVMRMNGAATGGVPCVGSGGNGGFQAINLAVQLGCKHILLVGFDMDHTGHWHQPHKPPLNNPSALAIRQWRQTLDDQAGRLVKAGIQVNVIGHSRLNAYPAFDRARTTAWFQELRNVHLIGS